MAWVWKGQTPMKRIWIYEQTCVKNINTVKSHYEENL